MTAYKQTKVELTESQIAKTRSGIADKTEVTIQIAKESVGKGQTLYFAKNPSQ